MIEIERKFLLTQQQFDSLKYQSWGILEEFYEIEQCYLVNQEDLTIRVRLDRRIGNKTRPPKGVLCIKKPIDGSYLVRSEEEYEIHFEHAMHILDPMKTIKKTRYRMGPYTIDVFRGDLDGLIIAEREYDSLEEALSDDQLPNWVTEDVTESIVYLNSNLVGKKFINGIVA